MEMNRAAVGVIAAVCVAAGAGGRVSRHWHSAVPVELASAADISANPGALTVEESEAIVANTPSKSNDIRRSQYSGSGGTGENSGTPARYRTTPATACVRNPSERGDRGAAAAHSAAAVDRTCARA